MRARGRGPRAAAGVVSVAIGLASVLASGPIAAEARAVPTRDQHSSAPTLIEAVDRVVFSPNGDHRQDHGRIGFKLHQPARVTVTVRNFRHTVVRRAHLGRLSARRHVWAWDGRTDNGRLVPDNYYDVTLRATTAARTESAPVYVRVDTAVQGELVTTRPTVYPRASAAEDLIQLVWLSEHWSADDRDAGGDVLATASISIHTPAGDVVWHRTVHDAYTPVFDWFARRRGGGTLPAGRYVARMSVADDAGNRRHAEKHLTVSHAQLVEEVWTTTMAAADAGWSDYYAGDPGCLGCYDICPPIASERFPGGWSFRPCPSPSMMGWVQVAHVGVDVPFAAAPVDSFRVTATGGPTTPGSGDVGYLDTIRVGPGDASATTPWSAVDLVSEPFLPDRIRPAHWAFSTPASTSYDVATFTVDYRHYVPVD